MPTLGLIIMLLFLLLVFALLVVLQVWLCKKNTKLGLILPGICLVFSLLLTLLLAINVVGAQLGNLLIIGVTFLVTNIPTMIFGGIWLHYKGRRDTLDDLRRMQINDLD